MLSKSFVATALLTSSAIASPALLRRDNGPDACPNTFNDGTNGDQCYVSDLRFFTDDSCTQPADPAYTCEYVGNGLYDPARCDLKPASGAYGCSDGRLPEVGP
jgi:hypothetical protein